MVNATNKLSDIGKDAANTISQNGVNPVNDNTVKYPPVVPASNEKENIQPVNNNAGSLSLHENSSHGYSIQYNKSNWNVEDNAAAGYGEPSTSFQNTQYPNDIAVTVSINPWNGGDFQNFVESVSGFNTNYNKMNIGKMYYLPDGRWL